MAIKLPKPAAGDTLDDIVKRIKLRSGSYVLETGKDLLEAKDKVPHGKFGAWLKNQLGWSYSTANNFMNAAKAAEKYPKIGFLKPTALILFGAPSTPESVKEEVLAYLEAGKVPTQKLIKEKIAAAKPKTEPKAKPKLTVVAQTVQAPVPAHVPEPKVAALFPALNEPTPGLDISQAADALKALGLDKAVEAFNVAFPGAHLALEMAGPSEPLLLEATA